MLGTNSTIIKGQPMNKSELIDAIASESGLSKADATRALNATTDAITALCLKKIQCN